MSAVRRSASIYRPARTFGMDFSGWLNPDDVMEKLLVGVFGPTATIVAIFLLTNFVFSWFGFAKSSVRIGRSSLAAASGAYRTVMRMRPAAVLVATIVTALLVILQVVWLWSASRIANGLSYLWNAPFGTGNPDLSGLVSYTRWDWISTLYLLASIGALIGSYVSAFGYGERDVIGSSTLVLALPLMLPWGLFSLFGGVLALLLAGLRTLSHDSPKMDPSGRIFLTVTLIVLCYTLAVSLALGSTQTIARFWRTSVRENG
jgi:hypothetical protein